MADRRWATLADKHLKEDDSESWDETAVDWARAGAEGWSAGASEMIAEKLGADPRDESIDEMIPYMAGSVLGAGKFGLIGRGAMAAVKAGKGALAGLGIGERMAHTSANMLTDGVLGAMESWFRDEDVLEGGAISAGFSGVASGIPQAANYFKSKGYQKIAPKGTVHPSPDPFVDNPIDRDLNTAVIEIFEEHDMHLLPMAVSPNSRLAEEFTVKMGTNPATRRKLRQMYEEDMMAHQKWREEILDSISDYKVSMKDDLGLEKLGGIVSRNTEARVRLLKRKASLTYQKVVDAGLGKRPAVIVAQADENGHTHIRAKLKQHLEENDMSMEASSGNRGIAAIKKIIKDTGRGKSALRSPKNVEDYPHRNVHTTYGQIWDTLGNMWPKRRPGEWTDEDLVAVDAYFIVKDHLLQVAKETSPAAESALRTADGQWSEAKAMLSTEFGRKLVKTNPKDVVNMVTASAASISAAKNFFGEQGEAFVENIAKARVAKMFSNAITKESKGKGVHQVNPAQLATEIEKLFPDGLESKKAKALLPENIRKEINNIWKVSQRQAGAHDFYSRRLSEISSEERGSLHRVLGNAVGLIMNWTTGVKLESVMHAPKEKNVFFGGIVPANTTSPLMNAAQGAGRIQAQSGILSGAANGRGESGREEAPLGSMMAPRP